MRHLRTLAELRSRYTALRGEELRTHIYITGGVPDQADRVVNIPHFTIHNGLPEVVLPDDGFGIGYVDETCDSEDVLA
jgi:hypothetical protein